MIFSIFESLINTKIIMRIREEVIDVKHKDYWTEEEIDEEDEEEKE